MAKATASSGARWELGRYHLTLWVDSTQVASLARARDGWEFMGSKILGNSWDCQLCGPETKGADARRLAERKAAEALNGLANEAMEMRRQVVAMSDTTA